MNWLAKSSIQTLTQALEGKPPYVFAALQRLEEVIKALEIERDSYRETPIEDTVIHEAYRAGQDRAHGQVALLLEGMGYRDLGLMIRELETERLPA